MQPARILAHEHKIDVSILTRRGRRVQQNIRANKAAYLMFQSSPAADGGCNLDLSGVGTYRRQVSILTRRGRRVQPPTVCTRALAAVMFQSSPAADGGCNSNSTT